MLHALGEIIVNVDADSVVESDAIANLVRPIVLGDADAVVGRIVVGNAVGIVRVAQAFEYTFGFHLRRVQSAFTTIFILSGAMCAYRRSSFKRTEGFRDYSKTEDLDFSMQLRQLGDRLVYADDAVCYTEGAASVRGLRHQRTRWRFGAFRCFRRHRRMFFDRRRGHRSLGWYELPASLLSYLQILLFPVVLAVAFGLPVVTGDSLYLVLIVVAIPANFAVVFWTSGTLRQHLRSLPALMPLMVGVMAVEHITMWSALGDMAIGRDTGWTKWQRLGVDGTAPPLPSVVVGVSPATASVEVPPSIMAQLTAGIAEDRDFEQRLDAALDEILVMDFALPVPEPAQ